MCFLVHIFQNNMRMLCLNKALLCMSIGAAAGAVVGTSTVTSYIESAAAVADGGRLLRCIRHLSFDCEHIAVKDSLTINLGSG